LSNYIPHWLKRVAENDLSYAFKLSNESSPCPEIFGRICPQDKLCEGACTLNDDGYGSITIGAIETSITERGFEAGYEINFPGITSSKRVAVIGSGPASLSAAHFLLRAGIKVEMFERDDRPGGLFTYGIPGFKLNKEVVQKRFDLLESAGLTLHLNCEIGKDISFETLKSDFDALFIGVGASASKPIKLEGEDSKGVILAIDYLRDIQKKLFANSENATTNVRGKKVVVIGGGDTAMDCVRTALREGASEVICAYRRDEANMPGSKKEVNNAKEEGVEFLYNASPTALITKEGIIEGVCFLKTQLGEADSSGRQRLREVEGSDFEEKADIVILALGFDHQPLPFIDKEIQRNEWGGLVVNEHYETSTSLIYAGGDCVRGADLAVTAARDGREAAFDMIGKLLD
jgi:glutamate synthase (NADPH/NADH) small chain